MWNANKRIFYFSLLILLFGVSCYSFADAEVQFPIKERAELEKILASVDLRLTDITIYQLGVNINIKPDLDGGQTQFETPEKILKIRNFNEEVLINKNSEVIGLGLHGNFKKIAPLNGLPHLRWVRLDGDLTELTGLSGLAHLEEIVVSSNRIKHIEDLTLPKLRYFDLYRNNIEHLGFLAKLSALEVLNLVRNNISSITPLYNLSFLKVLKISNNKLENVVIPSSMVNLTLLEAAGRTLSSVRFEALPSLNVLLLNNQPIKSMKGLGLLSNLAELSITGAQLEELYVGNLKQLKKLSFSSSKLTSLAKLRALNTLTNLESLSVYKSSITRIENVNKLTNLDHLNLSENDIEIIDSITGLVKLTSLNLSRNKLKKIQGLDHLKKLTLLDLSNNPIEVFEGVDSRMLDKVILSDTKIASIKGFSGFPVLGAVILKNTNIRNLEGYEEYLTRRDSSLVFFLSGNGLNYKEQGAILTQLLKYNVDYIL